MAWEEGLLWGARAEPAAPTLSREATCEMQRWADAMAWQRTVDRALSTLGLTHAQFRVLLGAAVATGDVGDAVMQQDIADAAGLDKCTTSRLVLKLGQAGLLDKNINGVDDRKLRVLVTRTGRVVLERACALVDAAASRESDSVGP